MKFSFDPQSLLRLLDHGGQSIPEGLEESVLRVFKTSLLTEEGVALRPFCVLTSQDTKLQYSTRWQTPISAAKGMAKLSKLSSHGVRALQLEARGELKIVSVVEVPRRSIHENSIWGGPLLEIDALSAGNIRVCSYGGGGGAGVSKAVRYNCGKYYVRTFEDKMRQVFAKAGVVVNDFLVSKYKNGFDATTVGITGSSRDEFQSSIFQNGNVGGGNGMLRVFLSAVARLQRRGLGGAVIILGPSDTIKDVPAMNPAEPFDSDIIDNHTNHWYSMIDFITAIAVYSRAKELGYTNDKLNMVEAWMNKALYWMNESAAALSTLMIPDGALILGKYLQPIAMGVKLSVCNDNDLRAESREYLNVNAKGMRHRSMASAIEHLPNSHGIVISNDGPVTLFRGKHVGDLAIELLET